MHDLYFYRDITLFRRYLATRNAKGKWQYVNIHSGMRRLLENLFLWFQYYTHTFSQCRKEVSNSAWAEILESSEELNWAFLIDTEWFNDTILVGAVGTSRQDYFIKFYKYQEGARKSVFNTQSIVNITDGIFVTSKILKAGERLIASELLSDYVPVVNIELAEKLCLEMCEKSLNDSKECPAERFPMIVEYYQLGSEIKLSDTIEKCLAHGDMTKYNCLQDNQGNYALIDYDEVGYYAPFYDYFHWHIQPSAMIGDESISSKKLLSAIQSDSSVDWLRYYLCHQLHKHMLDRELGMAHRQLLNMIKAKRSLLLQLV